MNPPSSSASGREIQRPGTSRASRWPIHDPAIADGPSRERRSADEHFDTPDWPLPTYERDVSDNTSGTDFAYPFPAPPPSKAPMWFTPQGTFNSQGSDVNTDGPRTLTPSRPSSDLGYTTKGGPSFYTRLGDRTPDSTSRNKHVSASGSDITVIGPDGTPGWQTLRDIEEEHNRQRKTMREAAAPERLPTLMERLAPEQQAPRPPLKPQQSDHYSETNDSNLSQVFSRRSSPVRAKSPLPHRPRTAGELESESKRRQSRFLDFHVSGSRKG